MARSFCVVYRTGGTQSFTWQRTLGMTEAEAIQAREETERMGYKALVERLDRSLAIGLPETWEV